MRTRNTENKGEEEIKNANTNVMVCLLNKIEWRVRGDSLNADRISSKYISFKDCLGPTTGGEWRRHERKTLQPGSVP